MHSGAPKFDEVVSILVKEPFNLTIAQIADLTPYQVRHHYFREKEHPPAPRPGEFPSSGEN